jgi:hypothetical protein
MARGATPGTIQNRHYRQGGWVPSEHTTTVLESCGTTIVVVVSGFAGLLLLMHPDIIATKTVRLDKSFIFRFLAAKFIEHNVAIDIGEAATPR